MGLNDYTKKIVRKGLKFFKGVFNVSKDMLHYGLMDYALFHKGILIGGIEHISLGGHVSGIVIDPKYRGKGYGTTLMKKAIGWIKKQLKTAKTITLQVYKDNKTAVNLYYKCGFRVVMDYGGIYRMELEI